MKGIADRTLELMNEYQADLDHKSWRTFQHFLVVKIETLEDKNEALNRVIKEVWDSIPSVYEPHDHPEIVRHAKALNALRPVVDALLTREEQTDA